MSVLVQTIVGGLIVAALVAAAALGVRDLPAYTRLLRRFREVWWGIVGGLLLGSLVTLYKIQDWLNFVLETYTELGALGESIGVALDGIRMVWWFVGITLTAAFYFAILVPLIAQLVRGAQDSSADEAESSKEAIQGEGPPP